MIQCNTYEEAETLANKISAETKESLHIFQKWLRSEKYKVQEWKRTLVNGYRDGSDMELVTVEKYRQVYSDKFTIIEPTDAWPSCLDKIVKFIANYECPFMFEFYSAKRDCVVECSFPTIEKAEKEFNWRKERGQIGLRRHYSLATA